ncbi:MULTISPECIES: CPBP family intramembrane glutamic endopeptidase [unclassified Exiguobacterium]|uniref:CPBP family intramembrane glutamic endopeptidase n=1 Tax=unclassified Exiguobacterium TaxID=2644629 RepID=UPI00103DE3C8|nr:MULTISPECIES: type II CAAX endopeptidase family protein [unclassified Exiguobacterium]TCI43012.1 CPBP family intramembrane metalloprotease [Exiguobacterium sp. SH5S32]TCI49798.1 CPBP family intramembrane metalloprotease [Exiguobacterium sp. SH1S4]TCI68033.1 CPBP family intramembrane metalloprotease [Exiguobacterium sp. SH1S1]
MIPTRKEVITFIVIAFAFSWLSWWGLYTWTSLPILATVLIGSFGPSVAGSYMAFRENGWSGVQTLLKRGFEWRMAGKYYAFGLLLIPFLFVLAYWLTDASGALLLNEPWLVIPYFLYMLFLGGTVQQEYGWRGYLLDALQLNKTPLQASLFVGVVWAVWHIPLFFMTGTGQASLPFWAYAVAILSFTLIISWLYNVTTMNLWAAFLLHTTFNVSYALVPLIEPGQVSIGFLYLTLLLFTTAIVLVWKTHGYLGYDHLEQLEAVEGSHQPNVTLGRDTGKEGNV